MTVPSTARPLDATRLARLRWRCRRGMLENDLILERFLARRGADLTEHEVAALDRLLDLADGDLWDVLCERAPAPPDAQPLLLELRR
jgi:antitoxin CptB